MINRRKMIIGIGGAGIVSSLSGWHNVLAVVLPENKEKSKEIEVTAVEDLMREHGILRRILFVYSESVSRLRKDANSVPADALQKAAKLFRDFGEIYHERKLEQEYIFPAIKKAGGQMGALGSKIDILTMQHNRGSEITEYILKATAAKIDAGKIDELVKPMETMVRMYRPHAATEDTIIFPAWKKTMSEKQYDEMGDKFEEIEHKIFGKDGFEYASGQISDIEKELGMGDLGQFTAPIPA